jgi:hypothetical protein
LCHTITGVIASGVQMLLRRSVDRARRGAGRDALVARRRHGRDRRSRPLDAAALILELDLARLIGQAGDSLRRSRDQRQARRPWWRRLLRI